LGEIFRDAGHYAKGDLGYSQGLQKNIPIKTDGLLGFLDQHIGDVVETMEFFYLALIPVELVSRAIEAHSDKKINPRVKLGISLFLTSAIVSALELSGINNTADSLDITGIIAFAIWSSVGYEVINYLFKPRPKEVSILAKWHSKISEEAKNTESPKTNTLEKLGDWIEEPD